MSAQGTSQALLLRIDELAILMAGCQIGDLFVPEGLEEAIKSESHVVEALSALEESGLMVRASDGMLDYSGALRRVLRTLRDATLTVLLWTADEPENPRFAYVVDGSQDVVVLTLDAMKEDYVRLALEDAKTLARDVLDGIEGLEKGLSREALDAAGLGNVEPPLDGELFVVGFGYLRAESEPVHKLEVLRGFGDKALSVRSEGAPGRASALLDALVSVCGEGGQQ